MSLFSNDPVEILSPNVKYTTDNIEAKYTYSTSYVSNEGGKVLVKPQSNDVEFLTKRSPQKTGVMFVGWGGNNGSTVTGGIIGVREKMTWNHKCGIKSANFYGSLTQSSTVKIGVVGDKEFYVPFKNIVPMVDPTTWVIGGWDINKCNLYEAMKRACVLDYEFQEKLKPYMEVLHPLPGLYYPDFIASNQSDRADNIIPGNNKREHLEIIRKNIRDFKKNNNLDTVILLWTANTERYTEIKDGIHDTWEHLQNAINNNEKEVSPSTMYCIAAILEGCTFINGSPQNTLVPGVIELSQQRDIYIGGNDFKSGQTKQKSVLVDYFVSAGLKPVSVVSYNHLGNNDGKNLIPNETFKSKEKSKSNVISDIIDSNRLLYKEGERPDHCVVIKYVPYVGDSKRALDEYINEIFCGGTNTIAMHNTCEDSLLAAPLMIDFIVIGELMERIKIKYTGSNGYERFHNVLSILGYLAKAPEVPPGSPCINSLFKQRECIVNLLRACVGLNPENHMLLEYKIKPLHF